MRSEDIVAAEVLPSDMKLLTNIIKDRAKEVIFLRAQVNSLMTAKLSGAYREND